MKNILSEDWLQDLSARVGQTVVASGVAIGEPLVVDAHQVQDRGMIVVDVARFGDDLNSVSSVSP